MNNKPLQSFLIILVIVGSIYFLIDGQTSRIAPLVLFFASYIFLLLVVLRSFWEIRYGEK